MRGRREIKGGLGHGGESLVNNVFYYDWNECPLEELKQEAEMIKFKFEKITSLTCPSVIIPLTSQCIKSTLLLGPLWPLDLPLVDLCLWVTIFLCLSLDSRQAELSVSGAWYQPWVYLHRVMNSVFLKQLSSNWKSFIFSLGTSDSYWDIWGCLFPKFSRVIFPSSVLLP